MDPYQSCPCGSGKSFKWCCQSYFAQVEKARKLHQEGQHESALKTIKQLVDQTPGNAPVLGYQAELFYMNAKPDEADDCLQKAFAINPDFPFGHWLRGVIRRDEGEAVGALIEFRKAAELYDPKATDVLAEIHSGIFDIEMRMNRPIAARAALERAIRYEPAAEQLRTAFDNLFGPDSRLPECARRAYAFRPADSSRAESWNKIIPAQERARLGDAAAAFEKLTAQDSADASAWFNLGLVRAWLSELPKAVEALLKAMEIDADDERNAEAGALIEVLRCGSGMEAQSDYVEHRIFFQMQQPQPIVQQLEEWQRNGRLSGAQSDQENGTFTALILEETPQFGLGIGSPLAKPAANMFIVQNLIRLWSMNKASVEKVAGELVRRAAGSLTPPMEETGWANFAEIGTEAILIPPEGAKINEIADKLGSHAQNYFEEIWINRPFKGLGGVSPMQAAGDPAKRKRLLGIVEFIQDCYISVSPRIADGDKIQIIVMYDFDRLRRKLGLAATGPEPASESGRNIETYSAAELAAVAPDELSDVEIEQAFRTALRHDDRELAGRFARNLVNRPLNGAQSDRFPFFSHLIQLAQAENDLTGVLGLLDQAEKADAEANNGSRRNDYTLRRAQALAKKGEVDQAYQVLSELIGREPNDLKYYGPAAETMLGQKRKDWALQFAENGLAKAPSQNNRDSEQYFMELVAAVNRLG